MAGSPWTPMLATSTSGADEPGRQLEGGGDADGFDGDVGAEAVGELRGPPHSGVLAAVVDHDVGAEGLGRLEAGVDLVDGDDVGGAVELGAEDGGQADGPGADDGDDVAGAAPGR